MVTGLFQIVGVTFIVATLTRSTELIFIVMFVVIGVLG